MRDINYSVSQLANYALDRGLIEARDRTWAVNNLLEVLGISHYEDPGRFE